MRKLRLYRDNWILVKEIEYTKEALDALYLNGIQQYSHWKVVWVQESKEVSESEIESVMGNYQKGWS